MLELRLPAGRFDIGDKNALADACDQPLVRGLGIPEGDRFVSITEHGPGELPPTSSASSVTPPTP